MNTVPLSPATTAASHRLGLLAFFGGLLGLSIFDASSKYLLETYPAPFLNVMRYTTVALIGVFMLARHRDFRLWRSPHKGLLILRGVALGTVGTCFMTALIWMPLAEATAIYFTSPLIVVALSPWMLQERVTATQWVALAGGFCGMLLIIRPGNDLPWLGTVLMVVSAISFAIFQLLTRRLSDKVPGHIQYSYAAFICLIITAVPAPFFPPDPWPDWQDLIFIVGLGLCNGAAQLLLIVAFQRVNASTLAPFNYFQLLMALGFSALWFKQTPDMLAQAGMVLIIVAGIFLAARRNRRSA